MSESRLNLHEIERLCAASHARSLARRELMSKRSARVQCAIGFIFCVATLAVLILIRTPIH